MDKNTPCYDFRIQDEVANLCVSTYILGAHRVALNSCLHSVLLLFFKRFRVRLANISNDKNMEHVVIYYPVVIHQSGDSAFGVTVPDLPGCHSAGDSMQEALENTPEAIGLSLESRVDDGDILPAPSDLADLKSNPEYADGLWVLIPIDESLYLGLAQRINISLPMRLITKMDGFVDRNPKYRDRSKFLADAAIKLMHTIEGDPSKGPQ